MSVLVRKTGLNQHVSLTQYHEFAWADVILPASTHKAMLLPCLRWPLRTKACDTHTLLPHTTADALAKARPQLNGQPHSVHSTGRQLASNTVPAPDLRLPAVRQNIPQNDGPSDDMTTAVRVYVCAPAILTRANK